MLKKFELYKSKDQSTFYMYFVMQCISTLQLPLKLFKNIFADSIPEDSVLIELVDATVPEFLNATQVF